jgi:nitroreductase
MIDNATLAAIRNRRSIRNFTSEPVTDDQITAVIEAGRWAPSARNSQPWDFVVVRDQKIRSGLGSILKQVTFSWGGLSAAPVMIIVSVDQTADSVHFIEDGAVAAQNLCLAAQSLGLGSSWAGVVSPQKGRNNVEKAIASLVALPRTHRVIAVVPIGVARNSKTTTRRPLTEIVHYDRYSEKSDSRPERADESLSPTDNGTRGRAVAVARQSVSKSGNLS